MRTVFVNPEKCLGCRQCEFACAVEHSKSKDPAAAVFETPPPRARIHVAPGTTMYSSFPVKCRHCDPAPCQQACPAGAISRGDQDLVQIDAEQCIACAMCAMVCPFDAITFRTLDDGMSARVVAVKCDGCADRVQRGKVPACVDACKAGALVFGELNELIADGRASQAVVALAATESIQPAISRVPANIVAWRGWGRAAANAREG